MIRIGEKNLNLIEKIEVRRFGFIVGFIFMVLGLFPFLKGEELNLLLIILASIMLLFAIVMPDLLSPFYKMWMRLGVILSKVNSFLILGIVFYFIFTPIGIIMRMFKKDSEKFAYKTAKGSYWIKRVSNNPADDMKRMF